MTEPTPEQVRSACLSYRHDYGLLSETERKMVQFEAREWLHAWRKEGFLGVAAAPPDGATHMRRPEYLTAWLFDGVATMPIWLIEKYKSVPIPEDRKGMYATAVDGEFWRWLDAPKFNELFVPVPSPCFDRTAVIEECAKVADDTAKYLVSVGSKEFSAAVSVATAIRALAVSRPHREDGK